MLEFVTRGLIHVAVNIPEEFLMKVKIYFYNIW